jgi:hypothetical protein
MEKVFALLPHDRVEHNGRPNVGDDQQQGSSRTGWKRATAPIDAMLASSAAQYGTRRDVADLKREPRAQRRHGF